MLIQNKSNIITSTVSHKTTKAGSSLTTNHLDHKRADALQFESLPKVLFGSSEKSKPTKTWKQYFSDLYNKVRDGICKFIKLIKSFFKSSATNQADQHAPKDASDSSVSTTQSRKLADLPRGSDFSEMTPEETTSKVRQLIEYGKNGKNHNDLSIEDQCFLGEFIREALSQPHPKDVETGKVLAELYNISTEDK